MTDTEALYDGMRFLQTNRSFLGREFLTWLWFLSETQKHSIEVPGLGEFKLYVDDKIVLSSSGGSVRENALKGGTPAYAVEARTALQSGKLVQEAKFILQTAEKQWMWNMRADDLSLRGVRLPPVQESEASSHIFERVSLMQTLVDVLDHLFNEYMAIRMTPKFDKELDMMGEWMTSKTVHEMYN